ncbi:MAG: hypothetical protein M1824_006070 [Vezdaea acicularis]|nr:MAG: hypothetical protein M1824_006070 [Vezdaea acicularis]
MAFRLRQARRAAQLVRSSSCPGIRPFRQSGGQLWTSAQRGTEDVYEGLSAMRVKTPWIEAFRAREREKALSPSQEPSEPRKRDLSPKKMSESRHTLILPLAKNPWLLDTYANATGQIRLGALFMDLDALAGVVAYKHTGESVMTVTAAIDRITIKNPRRDITDLQLSGCVTYATGRSSMEISLQVAKAPGEGRKVAPEDVLMTCAFTMVSLDPTTKKPVAVSPLLVETAEEKRQFALGEKNHHTRKALSKSALTKQLPTKAESDLIHTLWLRSKQPPSPGPPPTKMKHTHQTAVQIMQPQYRNRHNFMIFGGYLLKSTFELAFASCTSFSHLRPTFLSLDPSTFENPVPVGSLLYLTATVAYTEPLSLPPQDAERGGAGPGDDQQRPPHHTRVQIRVDTSVRDIENPDAAVVPTGQFNYTFLVEKSLAVKPESYDECMVWLDARRRVRRAESVVEEAGVRERVGRLVE